MSTGAQPGHKLPKRTPAENGKDVDHFFLFPIGFGFSSRFVWKTSATVNARALGKLEHALLLASLVGRWWARER